MNDSLERLATSPLGEFDSPRYNRIAVERAHEYQTAQPFPHAVFDDFLDPDLARAISAAFPSRADIEWVDRDNENNRRRYQHDETKLPTLIREMLRELNSRQFVLFLETLTGIGNLIPDPYFIGGGVHESTTGDFLNIHVDFNWHHKLQAHRRCNALLYFSDDWQPEWDGQTELWPLDMSGPSVQVLPVFNRMLVFNTSEISHHGQPNPNRCPEDVTRKVLNLYYYTSHADAEFEADPHFTLYKTDASPFATSLGADYRAQGGSAS
jgi:2-oxoglutarate-Fe(II)-dependent oxygenase superfamily protein